MTERQYYHILCKKCWQVMGSYPYTDPGEAVALFHGKFLCVKCTNAAIARAVERSKKVRK